MSRTAHVRFEIIEIANLAESGKKNLKIVIKIKQQANQTHFFASPPGFVCGLLTKPTARSGGRLAG